MSGRERGGGGGCRHPDRHHPDHHPLGHGAHGHDHGHDHGGSDVPGEPPAHGSAAHRAARSPERRRLLLTLVLTAVFFAVELAGGLLSHSLALLSDAGHMLTDLSAQLLSLLALTFASRPADARRTYGYYRLEILAALVNGVALLALAGFIGLEAIHRLGAPTPVRTGLLMAVAAVGLAANLAGVALLHGARSLNVKGAYLHLLSDTCSSVAVLVGGLVMTLRPGLWILDPLIGLAIALFVVYSAFRLLKDAVDVLLEAVPAGIDLVEVAAHVARIEGIDDVHDMHIWTITSGMHALSAHLVVRAPHSAVDNDELLARVKQMLLRDFGISHSTLQIESERYEHVGHVH